MSSTPPSARSPIPLVSLVSFAAREDLPCLPVPLNSFVGREREIADLGALVRDPAVRLVTLSGVGGVGKTRLALRVASEIVAEGHFGDGVIFVDLATVRDPDLVIPVIAQTLGVHGVGQEPTVSALKIFLGARHLLLILDNFEQVSKAGLAVIDLIRACPGLNVIVTSRSLLNVTGEQAMPVAPLSLTRRGVEGSERREGDLFLDVSPPRLSDASDAMRLFEERSRAVNPSFAVSAANGHVIAEIVQRLDGLPLAIELAAARATLLPPSALLARLDHPLPQLFGGPRDQPARHQTMRAAIAWSYELLTLEEQRVFRCLGVFAGGCALEAAQTICGVELPGRPGIDVEDSTCSAGESVLESLARQSLVRSVAPPDDGFGDDSTRVVMLETIREFAAERLVERNERVPGRRHAEYYRDMVVRAEPTYWGDAPGDRRAVIDIEFGNMRAAVDWAVENGEADLALRLVSARFDPHWTSGAAHAHVLRRWAHQALAMPGGSPVERVRALTTAAWLSHVHADFDAVRSLAGEALTVARAHEDAFGAASASFVLGVAAVHEGDLVVGRRRLQYALAGFRRFNAPGRIAWTLLNLASLDNRAGIDEGGDPAVLARAASLVEEASAIFQRGGNAHGVARATHCRAYVAAKQGDLARSLALSREVLLFDWERGLPIYFHLEDIADIAGGAGEAAVAARLYGAAKGLREQAGRPVEPVFRAEFERGVAAARRRLGEAAFAEASVAGQTRPIEEIVAEALDVGRGQPRPPRPSLTPRETDVLYLLAAEMTDTAIAEALFVSVRAVERHVANILTKLGVRTRIAAVAEGREIGLVPRPRA